MCIPPMRQATRGIHALLLGALILIVGSPLRAQTAQFRLGVTSGYLTNAYLDAGEEPDALVSPRGSVVVHPSASWSLGYRGRLDWFSELDDLTTHGHEAHVEYWHWSRTDEGLLRELWARTALQSLFNSSELEALDHLTPRLLLGGTVDLSERFSLAPSAELGYRSFVNDSNESQVNTFACTEAGVHLPTRTTLLLRPCYGLRWYLSEAGFLSDEGGGAAIEGSNQDAHQAELRFRVAQNLAEGLGLRVEYLGRLVVRRAERARVIEDVGRLRSDLTSHFRYDRHRPRIRLSWLATDALLTILDAAYERREYEGIDALVYSPTGTIVPSDADRSDDRLMLGTRLETRWRPTDRLRFTVAVDYSYLKIWSNADIYTSQSHELMLSVSADWTVGGD